ncbi:MAG: hypothetical protein A3G95_09565 [Flavobacteria bacterium RIFCSPLOWO2_12_FULL_31_7]|nr:MAG: hypothetical protein A3G95_09565 [Flavobacteria bacterium RIFCSPLOWO2_12_FULL_31_7]
MVKHYKPTTTKKSKTQLRDLDFFYACINRGVTLSSSKYISKNKKQCKIEVSKILNFVVNSNLYFARNCILATNKNDYEIATSVSCKILAFSGIKS